MINSEKAKLVDLVVEDIYNSYPELVEKFGDNGRKRTVEDNYHHIRHLETAYQMKQSSFFQEYTRWLNNVLTSRGVGTALIIDNYERLIKWMEQAEFDSAEEKEAYRTYLDEGIKNLKNE